MKRALAVLVLLGGCASAPPDAAHVETRAEFGPFTSLDEAVADMQAGTEGEFEPGESLEEAEEEIGISTWIAPDTGEPAEESVPRIEDH